MSSSVEGMIFGNILKLFPERGIVRIRQVGTWRHEEIKISVLAI